MNPKFAIAFTILLAIDSLTKGDNGNFIRNGDFSRGLEDWRTAGQIIADPEQARNRVVKIPVKNGVSGLEQDLKLPPSISWLQLSFRVRATAASASRPVQVRARFYDASGNSIIVAGKIIKKSDTWEKVVSGPFQCRMEMEGSQAPQTFVDGVAIEAYIGKGSVLIGDVELAPANPPPSRAQ